MLIGITGTVCSGVSEVVSFLVKAHEFKLITIKGSPIEDGLPTFKQFDDEEELINYTTKNWLENFVMSDISNLQFLDYLLKRPFFLHVTVDSSLMLRFNRYKLKSTNVGFEKFAQMSDDSLYANDGELLKIMDRSEIKLINNTKTIEEFTVMLTETNLLRPERLRPTWDAYFMRLADLAALRSNCMKRRVGCVVVRENRVIATGYNGTPRNFKNCNEGGCSRCNSANAGGSALSTCLCLHAEENALLESGRDRVGSNAVLYCNTCPCLTCSIKIVQCGIGEVVYSQSYSMDNESSKVFNEAGVKLRQYTPTASGIMMS